MGQGVGNARLARFQFQPSLLQPATHQLLALPHDRLVPMQDHDIVSVADHAGGIKSRAPVAAKACPDERFEAVQGNVNEQRRDIPALNGPDRRRE